MAQFTFSNVQADHLIEAQFEVDVAPPVFFTITATAGAGGTIFPGGVVSVLQGSDQVFDITADPGFHISKILVDGVEVVL
jgi:hypothetical protein